MKNRILLTSLYLLLYTNCFSQMVHDYILKINKVNQSEANLYIDCSFTLDFQNSDSLSMNFGGDKNLSIENLQIENNGSLFKSYYDSTCQRITFYRCSSQVIPIKMNYYYTNLSTFFIYGEGNAELWETSFGEYFYPFVPNTYMDIDFNVEIPDSLFLLCSYPMKSNHSGKFNNKLRSILSQSLTLAFIQNEAYQQTTAYLPNKISIYQIKNMQCSKERYEELILLTKTSIDFFSKVYGEEYISTKRNITTFPTYLFHNGKGFSNRYNIGFISASQEKFSTYPDIYPLVHEIGHRWLGEWTLLIDDGQPGAYFIKESLNEFMTLMFIRYFYGPQTYERQLDWCKSEYEKIKDTSLDEPIINIVVNNNNIVIYRKGPLLLDCIAKKIGYDKLIEIISRFYSDYAGKYPLKCSDFINIVNKYYPKIEDLLYN